MTTRIAWFNGKLVPETDVMIPFRDRSFNRGDGCFDMTRTFQRAALPREGARRASF
jgi:branched-subunit amino acid aminotransferase/4-amino-4-deoxychorismate lyase